jgi:hypothetical protein
LLGLYEWLLTTIRAPTTDPLKAVGELERTIDENRTALLGKIRRRMAERIDANRRLWRSRVLRQLTQTWSTGPLAGLLSLWSAAGSLVRSLILLRARTPIQALLAGGVALSQYVGEKWRERQTVNTWAAEADLGLTEADLAMARSVLRGRLADAQIELPSASAASNSASDLSSEQLTAVALQVYQKLDSEITAIIEQRVHHRAGRIVHAVFELAFCLLPAYLVLHMGRNFFYEHLWHNAPLLSLDFFLQAAFWCLAWGAGTSALLLYWLNAGLSREFKETVGRLSPEHLFDALYADSATACQAIRRHAQSLDGLGRDLKQLKDKVGGVLDLGLGALRVDSDGAKTKA